MSGAARAVSIGQAIRPVCVEAQYPIAKGLSVYAANTGGFRTAHTVVNCRKRQQSPVVQYPIPKSERSRDTAYCNGYSKKPKILNETSFSLKISDVPRKPTCRHQHQKEEDRYNEKSTYDYYSYHDTVGCNEFK